MGYIEDRNRPTEEREELKVLRKLGFTLVQMTLPDDIPAGAITLMLGTEAAAVFDELTRKHISEGLNTWPDTFRQGQFVPAVEYLRAARVRTKLMGAMAERMAVVDLYVGSGQDLVNHESDRPPDRRLSDGIPRAQWPDDPGLGDPHGTTLRRVNFTGCRPSLPAGDRRPPQAATARALPGGTARMTSRIDWKPSDSHLICLGIIPCVQKICSDCWGSAVRPFPHSHDRWKVL